MTQEEFKGITSQELVNNPEKLEAVVEQAAQMQVTVIEAQRKEQEEASAQSPQSDLFKPGTLLPDKFDAVKFKAELKEKLRVEIHRFAEKNIDIPKITTYANPKIVLGAFTATPKLATLEMVEQRLQSSNLATGEELDITDKEFVLKAVDDYINALAIMPVKAAGSPGIFPQIKRPPCPIQSLPPPPLFPSAAKTNVPSAIASLIPHVRDSSKSYIKKISASG